MLLYDVDATLWTEVNGEKEPWVLIETAFDINQDKSDKPGTPISASPSAPD